MRKPDAENDKEPNGKGIGPTRSVDGSVVGAGSKIGPFRIEHELGRGGAGVVYLAHDTKLDREPNWSAFPQDIPTNIRSLLRHCLEKDPRRRLQHIGDTRIEISETLSQPATLPPIAEAKPIVARASRSR